MTWDGEGAPLAINDARITHVLVDRPSVVGGEQPGREYVQPQWVVDCINAAMLLPASNYAPGADLPVCLLPNGVFV